MQLLEGVVVPPFVAKVEDQIGPELGEIALQGTVVVEVAELVARHLRQRILELAHGFEVFRIEGASALDLIGQTVVTHDDSDVERLQPPAMLAHQLRGVGGEKDAPRHHAEILVPIGEGFGMAMVADVAEARLLQQLGDAVACIEAFGIKLVGDYTHLVVDNNFARDQPFPILADRTLATDEMMLINPLPRPPFEVVVHVAAVGNVQYDLPAGRRILPTAVRTFSSSCLLEK